MYSDGSQTVCRSTSYLFDQPAHFVSICNILNDGSEKEIRVKRKAESDVQSCNSSVEVEGGLYNSDISDLLSINASTVSRRRDAAKSRMVVDQKVAEEVGNVVTK